jgi:uncharacterized protein YciI
MASNPLPDVALEQIFVIEATYAPDAAETRTPFRAEHLARAAELRDQGTIIEVGAFADMSGSMLLVRAANEEEATALARADVYMKNGVWVELRVRRFGRVVRPSERAAQPAT